MPFTIKRSLLLAISHHSIALLLILLTACSATDLQENSSWVEHEVAPGPAEIVPPPRHVIAETNQPIQLNAYARSRTGTITPVSVDWSTAAGGITSTGLFSASKTGTYKITGRARGRRRDDTTTVVVVPPQPSLTAVGLDPDSVEVRPAERRTFQAEGLLSDSSVVQIGVSWRATGGTIDAGGTYMAGSMPGTYRVIAADVAGNLADTAVVVIDAADATSPTLEAVVLTPTSAAVASGRDSAVRRPRPTERWQLGHRQSDLQDEWRRH